jgi:hypothetical protein
MKLSEKLQILLEKYENQPLPLGELLEGAGEQGFGLISGLLTLPLLIPVPIAGFSTLLGSGVILMGLQLALGFDRPHLPLSIARREISAKVSQSLLKALNRVLRPLERLTRTRFLSISRNPILRRMLGLCLAWNAVLMALPLPIPFTNQLPAYTIIVLSIGIFESDGFLLLFGYGMTIATTIFFASIASVIWALILHLGQ